MPSPYDVSALFRVDNLVCVVTGGGTGLGLTISLALDANGAKAVYIVGRREDKLLAAANQASNGSLIPLVGDVTSPPSLKSIAERVRADHGYVNAVIANAGVGGYIHPILPQLVAGLPPAPRTDTAPSAKEFADSFWAAGTGMDSFTDTLRVNATGTFFTAIAFLELLVAGNEKGNVPQKSQILVNTSAGVYARGHPGPAYVASKAAAAASCRQLATFFGPYTVRVNDLALGFFPSKLSDPTAEFFAGEGVDATVERAIAKSFIPLGRFGTNEELAGLVLFLLSKAGGYMDGSVILCDGGVLSQVQSSY